MIDFDTTSFGYARAAMVAPISRGYDIFGVTRHATSTLRKTFEEVRVGEARYRLRSPLTLTFYPFVLVDKGELIPEPDSAAPDGWSIIGTGVAFDDAFQDWSAKLHMIVQNLLAKRPWEMTQEEVRNMASMERMIDIPAYHRETPHSMRQIGTVARSRPIPDCILWEDGLVEHVKLYQMPPDFATFVNGQRFEAITVRDSMNGELQRVSYVGKLGRLKAVPPEQWEKTQTFLESPVVGWDEID